MYYSLSKKRLIGIKISEPKSNMNKCLETFKKTEY